MRQAPPNTVTGPVAAAPAHAARPAPPRAGRLAALAAVVLVAIGLGIVGQKSSGEPARSTPSSAQFMKDDGTGSPPRSR